MEDDLEVFVAHLRAKGLAKNTSNHYIQNVKGMFRWAVRKGYLTKNPISEDSALKREKGNRRSRRLLGDEEAISFQAHHLARISDFAVVP